MDKPPSGAVEAGIERAAFRLKCEDGRSLVLLEKKSISMRTAFTTA
jgi:hypothetical protein